MTIHTLSSDASGCNVALLHFPATFKQHVFYISSLLPPPPTRYLSQEEVLDQSNPFVQLISGVVWLLRNGQVYINQSLQVECDKTQETGWFSLYPSSRGRQHTQCLPPRPVAASMCCSSWQKILSVKLCLFDSDLKPPFLAEGC